MRIAPTIALLVVGAALFGGGLELLTSETNRATMGFDEALATLGTWLMSRFMTIASVMKRL